MATIVTKSRPWIHLLQQQPVSRFHLSARLAKDQPRATSSVVEASSSAPTRGPQSGHKFSKPDTRRKAQRPETTNSTTSSKDHASQQPNSVTGQVRLNRAMDSKEIDKEILRLVRARTAWKDIDAALSLPHSKAHHRYHTHLDPALKAWRLPNGQPNLALQDRLVYLVEVEKLSFAQIEKYRLMDEPWKTPTAFAPAEVLEAAGIALESTEAGAVAIEDPSVERPRKNSGGPFNRVRLQWKYNSLKSLAAANTLRENDQLVRKAIQRSVELYGENWKAVAAHSDSLLDQWITPALPRTPLTPTKVATEFRIFQRTGVDWGLEDDVVMTRKILALGLTQPDILNILTKPFSESKQGVVLDQEQQKRYWTEISVALGNHSPVQCQRRWKGLWNLHDGDKSAQSKSWHRFERFQYWMMWKYFSQQRRDVSGAKLTSAEDLQAACEELSHSKEIARWMRHRTEAQCDKFFRSSIRSVLNPSQDKLATMLNNTIIFIPSSSSSAPTSQVRLFESKEALANAIVTELADPLLIKMTVVSTESQESIRGDHQQPLIRSEWTPDRIRTLNEIVLQEKQGVQRADLELDWDQIAQALEQKYAAGSLKDTPTGVTITESTGSLIAPQPSLPFTPKQCQSCWEYISTIPKGNKVVTAGSVSDPFSTVSGDLEGKESPVQGWSENEILLLQQGVRKHGTLWADIRAQFLPNKDISDLQRAWSSISGPKSEQGSETASAAAAVDRLSEPDYVGLLSALDKVGVSNSSAGGKDK
ncbi:hypothetical protein KI688_012862 [Linnemannia hyalina]|uniref:Myb-like domain-containing protein n=1 Tax=Linnemannia hyalina TaxID=64524 RepID=A0A9P7XTE6_9FUNG|nr:hypothetical protein KI688_012862 [Linnemannia hyalina]